MPKQSPIPDEIDRPFWDACNEDRLVLQYCGRCERFQYPPLPDCREGGSDHELEWREVEGRGHIYSYAVIYDTPVESLKGDQPFNAAVITLDGAPGINMLSHLPGTPTDEVPINGAVELVFETTPGTGQKVPEWRIC